MNPNNPGEDASYPGNPDPNSPTNPSGYPQQPYPEQPQPAYGQQPSYPQQPPPYQPPLYNQTPPPSMPAGQPQYPPQPVSYLRHLRPMNALPQQQPKNSRKSWIIGCSIASGVVIILCTVLCTVMSFALFPVVFDPIGRETDAKTTIQNLCLEMQRQNYERAYNYLSIAAKGRVGTVDQFMNRVTTLDRSEGIVTSCVIDSDSLRAAAMHSDGKRMYVGIWVFRGNNTSNDPAWSDKSVNITLVHENNAWKVDDADPTHMLF